MTYRVFLTVGWKTKTVGIALVRNVQMGNRFENITTNTGVVEKCILAICNACDATSIDEEN